MLEINNICKTFNAGTVNEKKALKNLSLTLNDGDFVTVGVYCEHEEVDIVYELSFDTDLELIGLDAKQKRKGLFG